MEEVWWKLERGKNKKKKKEGKQKICRSVALGNEAKTMTFCIRVMHFIWMRDRGVFSLHEETCPFVLPLFLVFTFYCVTFFYRKFISFSY